MANSLELKQKRKSLHLQMLDLQKRTDENGKLPEDAQEQWDKINSDVDALSLSIRQTEKAEQIRAEILNEESPVEDRKTEEKKIERADAFLKWVRRQPLTAQENEVLMRGTDSQTVGTAEHGGRLVPDEWAANILKVMAYYSGILEAADVVTTGAGNKMYFPVVDETAVKGSLITETTGDTVSDVTWTLKELDAYTYTSGLMKVSYELLQDNAYNLESHLQELAAERLGRILNEHCTTGTGSSQPNGVVTASTLGKTAASATAITRAEIVDLIHSVDRAYRNRPGFRLMMNDSTLAYIKKLDDGDSRPLWSPSMRDGEPDRIEGVPYIINNDMAAIATGNKTILAGDFNQFKLRMVRGIEWKILTERYAETRQNGYFAFMRFDSELLDATAVNHLIQA